GATHYWGARVELNKSTPTLPVKPYLRTGDLIHVSGLPVLLDVTADVVLLGAAASVGIHPPIFAGQSPADNAVVVVNPADLYFNAVLVNVSDFPQMDSTRYIDAGLTLTWQEQPS